MKEIKPFVKWAGGKKQIISEIRKYYDFEKNNKYAEVFVGGGAVLFDILSNYDLKEVYISDINKELINCYIVIRDNVKQLINELEKIEEKYLNLNMEKKEKYFLKMRKEYNILKKENYDVSVRLASLFIFLNKTCFNGLYRVNSKGEFNTSFGKVEKPHICQKNNLILLNSKMAKTKIVCGDYKKCLDFVDENTFVYLDPPYRPLTKTSSFTSYNEATFGDKEQKELADFVHLLDKKGASILVSNSNPKNVDENDTFFEELYKGFNINVVLANRMINCKGGERNKISELLISNKGNK